ncbi:hypothetical protein [Portibacter lacus]|uniref:Uncharacterized protein n=1 Tax=Portibacter lacus TaxID=1099794 RepID=A0AA37SV32_9BACT|nr:hypothetical protein [Portibacter lacus]GLR20179.1 hypothetical protein GCM10007940_47950 [Portibacter lacus]
MKNLSFLIVVITLYSFQLQAQSTTENRIAYSYLSGIFENGIVEQLDKSKLSSKEEKLYTKCKEKLEAITISYFEQNLTSKLKDKNMEVMPLNAVSVMGMGATNLKGNPAIFFPKKTLKKHADKDIADTFLSASISINKPIVSIGGMKPEVIVTLKHFNKKGELINKSTANAKTEKKVSNIGFSVSQSESFNKIDMDHIEILFSRVEEPINLATEDAFNQLFVDGEISEN